MVTPETRVKVVVRHLPPTLGEDAFRETVAEWLDRVEWLSFVGGKTR